MIAFLRTRLHNLTSDKKFSEILTGSAWALGARVLATGLGLATSVIVARFYGAEVVGIVAVVNSFLMLTSIFTVLGTNTSVLRLIPEHMAKYSPTSAFRLYRKTQFLVIGFSVAFGTFLFCGAHFIASSIFSKPHLSFYFALAAVFLIFKSLITLNTEAVRGIRLIRGFAFMQILPVASNLILLILFATLFFTKDDPVYAMLLSLAVTGIIGWIIMELAFKHRMRPGDQVQDVATNSILSVSLPMLMTQTMNFVIAQTGVIMLGIFRPEAEVGYYSIAVKLATLTGFILNAINSMGGPKFSELFHAGKLSELFYVAQKSAKLIFWTTTPVLVMLIILGREVLRFFYGNDFTVAYPTMLVLAMGQFVNSVSGSTGMFMNMVGHQDELRNIILVAAAINIILSLALIGWIGMIGVAVAAMVSMSFWNIMTLLFIKKEYGEFIGYLPFRICMKG